MTKWPRGPWTSRSRPGTDREAPVQPILFFSPNKCQAFSFFGRGSATPAQQKKPDFPWVGGISDPSSYTSGFAQPVPGLVLE